MKQDRRHRHLRPRPTRSQLNQQIARIQSLLQLFQLEWLLESQRPAPCCQRLRFLHDRIVEMRDELETLEEL
jgi:hypothetical protein